MSIDLWVKITQDNELKENTHVVYYQGIIPWYYTTVSPSYGLLSVDVLNNSYLCIRLSKYKKELIKNWNEFNIVLM